VNIRRASLSFSRSVGNLTGERGGFHAVGAKKLADGLFMFPERWAGIQEGERGREVNWRERGGEGDIALKDKVLLTKRALLVRGRRLRKAGRVKVQEEKREGGPTSIKVVSFLKKKVGKGTEAKRKGLTIRGKKMILLGRWRPR